MRGFKAKALRRLAKKLVGEEEATYMTEPVGGRQGPTHDVIMLDPLGVPIVAKVINPMVRVDKAYRLYKKMKRQMQ